MRLVAGAILIHAALTCFILGSFGGRGGDVVALIILGITGIPGLLMMLSGWRAPPNQT
jgi:hypothetical protein